MRPALGASSGKTRPSAVTRAAPRSTEASARAPNSTLIVGRPIRPDREAHPRPQSQPSTARAEAHRQAVRRLAVTDDEHGRNVGGPARSGPHQHDLEDRPSVGPKRKPSPARRAARARAARRLDDDGGHVPRERDHERLLPHHTTPAAPAASCAARRAPTWSDRSRRRGGVPGAASAHPGSDRPMRPGGHPGRRRHRPRPAPARAPDRPSASAGGGRQPDPRRRLQRPVSTQAGLPERDDNPGGGEDAGDVQGRGVDPVEQGWMEEPPIGGRDDRQRRPVGVAQATPDAER